jgi:hypothetical protein
MSFDSVAVSNCDSLKSSNWIVVKIVNDLEKMCKEASVAWRFKLLFRQLRQETKETHGKVVGIIGAVADIQTGHLPSAGQKLWRLRQRD